jgi:hypothetical protein
MSALDLGAIQARADAAPRGPWYVVYSSFEDEASIRQEEADGQRRRGDYVEIAETSQCADDNSPTAEFIAHAREDVPALIARIRELEAAAADRERLLPPSAATAGTDIAASFRAKRGVK